MWQRFTLRDARAIGHYLGVLILVFGVAMVIPFVTALVFKEWEPAARYLMAIGISLIVGSLLRFLRIGKGRLTRQQAIGVTGFAWLVLAFIASIPLFGSGHYATYLDALFDGVSGLTTTGATIISNLDHLSNADNMFRFLMHFGGGIGLIVIALSFGLFGKGSGGSLFSSEGRTEHVLPTVLQTARFYAKVTAVVVIIATCLLMAMCVFIGMEPSRAFLHALWLSITSFVTGGFAPMSQSALYYHSVPMECLLMVLMLMGSVSFLVYSEVSRGRVEVFFRDIEVRTCALWIITMTVVFVCAMCMGNTFTELPALIRRGVFMVIATSTTTGLQTIMSNQISASFTSGAFLILAALMAIGGCSSSTAGGIKFLRIGIIFKSVVATVKESLSPTNARVVVTYQHIGRRTLDPVIVKEAMTIFILFIITYAVGTFVGIAHGYDAPRAIFESVAMASNGGVSMGIISPGMPASLELFYMFEMWAGRLEFVTLFAFIVKVIVSVVPRRKGKKVKG